MILGYPFCLLMVYKTHPRGLWKGKQLRAIREIRVVTSLQKMTSESIATGIEMVGKGAGNHDGTNGLLRHSGNPTERFGSGCSCSIQAGGEDLAETSSRG